MPKPERPLAAGALFALVLAMSPATAWAAKPLAIVAAENFYGDVAREIGGDHVTVTSIISQPDADPHLFEASPTTARAIADADIVISNGAGYDSWMEKLVSAAPAGDRAAIVAADLVGAKDGDNPHLWYAPRTMPAVAAAVEAELARRDPANAADYKANLAAFNETFVRLTDRIATLRSRYAGTPVTATEPVFGYMAEALGLKMMNVDFQRAVMNDAEPSPSDVAAFEESLKTGAVKILFYNGQVTDQTTERLLKLAEAGGVAVVPVTETEPDGKTLEAWFSGQLDAVDAALGRTN